MPHGIKKNLQVGLFQKECCEVKKDKALIRKKTIRYIKSMHLNHNIKYLNYVISISLAFHNPKYLSEHNLIQEPFFLRFYVVIS